MGELRVTNGAGEVVLSLNGDQGNAWHGVSVGVFSASFVFEYRRGAGYRGDAAVAQVAVSCGAALPPSSPPPLLPPLPRPTLNPPSPPPVLTLDVTYYDFSVHKDGYKHSDSHPDFERGCGRPYLGEEATFFPCNGQTGLVEATLGADGRRRTWHRAW